MRAIKIDAEKREIYEIDFPEKPKLQDYYDVIAGGCDIMELVRVGPDVDMYIDEEGKLKNPIPDGFCFLREGMNEFTEPYAGSAIIIGHTDDGDAAPLPSWVTLQFVKEITSWVNGENIQEPGEIKIYPM